MARKVKSGMTLERAKELIELNLKQMMWDLQVNMWTVTIVWDEKPEADDSQADVQLIIDYKIARIRFRLETIRDDEHFLECVLHELFHIVLAGYDLYSDSMFQFCDTERDKAQHNRLWVHVSERAVWNMEAMFKHGIKYVYPMYRNAVEAPVSS